MQHKWSGSPTNGFEVGCNNCACIKGYFSGAIRYFLNDNVTTYAPQCINLKTNIMNYEKLIGYAIDTNFIFDTKIQTEERAKEIVDKLSDVGYLERMTLIRKRIFTLYDYSTCKGIKLSDFLNDKTNKL